MAQVFEAGQSWVRRAVVYQIYPRSFQDSNGDGIGDLQGVIEKLDYLSDGTEKSLGIEAIWLSPVYTSPMVDFGYDISNYKGIDPIFGNLEDFDRLIEEAHKRGMKVIMDFVPNHTSDHHPWFLSSRFSKTNPKRDWYIWRDPKPDDSPPNNWLSRFGGSAWSWDEKTGQYYYHSFLPQQPDLNWRNPHVKEEMLNVLRFWLHRGVDGFRTDAVYHLIKDDQFRDDPPNPAYVPGKSDPYDEHLPIYSQGQTGTLDHINAFCEILGQHGDTFLVSEAYIDLPELTKVYGACVNNLHAPFNFNLMAIPWEAASFKKFIDEFENLLPPEKWPNYVMGNHDRSRVASRLGQNRARLVAMLLLTLRGLPFIYYGDELGMEDVEIPPEKVVDPWEKRVPGFKLGRDPERTPMQWTSGKFAGFSQSEPWLPLAQDFLTRNVEGLKNDSASILNLYKKLIHLRKRSQALLTGTYQSLDVKNEQIFAYERDCADGKLLVVLNFSDQEELVGLDVSNKAELVCSSYLDGEPGRKIESKKFVLRPHEGYIIKL